MALHDLIAANSDWILSHTRTSKTVAGASVVEPQCEYGVRLFLTQVCERLRREGSTAPSERDALGASAARHGIELFGAGFTLSQVVNEYGDVCQAITALAEDRGMEISAAEFRLLNRALDTAIAQAVTAHSSITEDTTAADDAERVAHATRDLRAALDAAVSSFEARAAGRKSP